MSENISRSLVILSATWAGLGLLAGLTFRELTRHSQADPDTLGLVHGHTLVLGMFFMLITLIFQQVLSISEARGFTAFLYVWNFGLLITVSTLFIRGLRSLWGAEHSAAIAGIAGLGHILLTIGLVFFFRALLKSLPSQTTPSTTHKSAN